MKKRRFRSMLKAINNYVVFFLTVAFAVSCCMMLFVRTLAGSMGLVFTEENIGAAAKVTFLNVLLLTLLFGSIDYVRRKLTVDRPVKIIIEATERIMQGDFSVRVRPMHGAGMEGFHQIGIAINAMAKELGHTIVEPQGSLVPLETAGHDCQEMQGLSLRNVGVKLLNAKGKVLYKDFGELLFTHFGVSGPTVLSASCHLKGEGCKLVIDLKPALEENKLDDRILRDLDMYQNRSMENALTDLLPRSMIPVVLRRLEIDPEMQANSLTRGKRRELGQLLKAFSVEITGKRPVAEAIITSGGVKVSEIDPKTMESKKISGLYFAGEIIDCDAYTGGFNLQIAWATAYAAGLAVSSR